MKRMLIHATSTLTFLTLAVSSVALPRVERFAFEDTGIMGCSGAAYSRGSKGKGPVYAAWSYSGTRNSSTMVLKLNGKLQSFAYNRSKDNRPGSATQYLSGEVNGVQVDLNFKSFARKGEELWSGNGAMRVYTTTPGDSVSIPVYVQEGC